MTGRTWIVQRAALALLLMVSFYALAFGLAAFLVWIPYEAYANGVRLPPKFALICLGFAGAIVWAVLPRPDRFDPPGPSVTAVTEPELFKVLGEVASATDQEMPAEVYLVNDVNAFVAQRGGVMGLGSRRVMGLGLPLMQAISIQEFKGIVAHEFGHYHAGDVKIGPWIYKTRAAIGRAIARFSGNVLQKIFIWYGNLFLRVTHAVSRRQEFIADEIAARVAGSGAMVSGLRTVHAATFAFGAYWSNDLAPVLQSGYLPPVHAGFARFLQSPGLTGVLEAIVRHEEAKGQTNLYDTHPSLRDRVAALSALPPGSAGDTRRASALLTHLSRWERAVLGAATGAEWARDLKPLDWELVGDTVYVPLWRLRVKTHGHLLKDLTIATVPTTEAALVTLGSALFGPDEEGITDQHRLGRAWQLVIAAIALPLTTLGWTVQTLPGEEAVFRRGQEEFRPFSEVGAVMAGKATPDEWRARCVALGIAEVALGDGAGAT